MKKNKANKMKEQFIEEMLSEVKNLKDLAKEELPVVAKEYIAANKIGAFISLTVGISMLIYSVIAGYHAAFTEFEGEFRKIDDFLGFSSVILSVVGFIATGCAVSTLIDLYLQPRRMAIKAITSLTKGE